MTEQQIWERISPEPNSGCWLWAGVVNQFGYGRTYIPYNRMTVAHRYVYEHYKGPIPAEMDLDHKCRVRCCVNPDHLEPVTRSENLKRGQSKNKIKTHCPQGHAYSPENIIITNGGISRKCKICDSAIRRAYRARKKAA